VTHGIDLFSSDDGQTITIFAVNHLPDPEHFSPASAELRAPHPGRSQIEVFEHNPGSATARWVRSIRHPLIRTPNDLYATSATSFYATNDHYYRSGVLRELEDLLEYNTGAWSDVVHVTFSTHANDGDAASGVSAQIAFSKIHNPNGMGHTSDARPNEVLVADAAGGELYVMERDVGSASPELSMRERIQLDSTVDNPSYYDDPYATTASNASGYVIAGLAVALDLAKDVRTRSNPIPTLVWYVRRDENGAQEKRIIFQDDGTTLRSASAAVLMAIDPKDNDGKKQAWLWVTGFVSQSIVVAKVDL